MSNEKVELAVNEALMNNEMRLVGDKMIGCEYALAIRFYSDPTKARSLIKSGDCSFTIGAVNWMVGGKEIKNKIEKEIATFLLFHGRWADVRRPVKVTDGELEEFDFAVYPEETTSGQDFEIVGQLSEMISNQYLYSTSDDTGVKFLAPKCDVNQLGIMIPNDYKGRDLKLWRFRAL